MRNFFVENKRIIGRILLYAIFYSTLLMGAYVVANTYGTQFCNEIYKTKQKSQSK